MLFFQFPEKHPWPFWMAAPIAVFLCTLIVIGVFAAGVAFLSLVFWTLPTYPGAATSWLILRILVGIGCIYAMFKLAAYYREDFTQK